MWLCRLLFLPYAVAVLAELARDKGGCKPFVKRQVCGCIRVHWWAIKARKQSVGENVPASCDKKTTCSHMY